MAKRIKHNGCPALQAIVNHEVVYLFKTFNLFKGTLWTAHVYSHYGKGIGHHKTNKFTAVENAFKDIR